MRTCLNGRVALALLLGLLWPRPDLAAQFTEQEGNDNKASASGPFMLTDGSTISGSFLSSIDVDYFRIQAQTASPLTPVVRYRLSIAFSSTTTPATISLRGRFGNINSFPCNPPGFDVALQTGSVIEWYGDANLATEVYVSIQGGTAGATAGGTYVATLLVSGATVERMGTFLTGTVNLNIVALAIADWWIYGPGFQPLVDGGATSQSILGPAVNSVVINQPGTYRVAVALQDLANTSCTDVGNGTSGDFLDFASTVAAVDGGSAQQMVGSLSVNGAAPREFNLFPATNSSAEVRWFEFDLQAPGAVNDLVLEVQQTPGGSDGASGGGTIQFIHHGPPNAAYFFCVTFNAGSYPEGWFFGLDIPLIDLVAQFQAGTPFVGVIGPFGFHVDSFGVPPSLSGQILYTVARRLDLSPHPATPLEITFL